MSVNLRRAKKSDIDQVLEIEKDSFKEPWSKTAFLHELSLSEDIGLFYVAEENGKINGYILIHLFEEGLHIINIAVRKSERKKGIGTMMLKKALSIAREKNIPLLVLEVRESNTSAINLYKKFGFNTVSVIANYYSDGENALLMIKEVKKEH